MHGAISLRTESSDCRLVVVTLFSSWPGRTTERASQRPACFSLLATGAYRRRAPRVDPKTSTHHGSLGPLGVLNNNEPAGHVEEVQLRFLDRTPSHGINAAIGLCPIQTGDRFFYFAVRLGGGLDGIGARDETIRCDTTGRGGRRLLGLGGVLCVAHRNASLHSSLLRFLARVAPRGHGKQPDVACKAQYSTAGAAPVTT